MIELGREGVVTAEDSTLDKGARFEAGPWQDEPDRVEWRYGGMPCLIVRNRIGALCGYVGVSMPHPWWGRHYDAVRPYPDIHGGLTYADHCSGHVCHVARPGEGDDVYWLGFDCAHSGDLLPELVAMRAFRAESRLRWPGLPDDTYRDADYVMLEVESLARQAMEARRPWVRLAAARNELRSWCGSAWRRIRRRAYKALAP